MATVPKDDEGEDLTKGFVVIVHPQDELYTECLSRNPAFTQEEIDMLRSGVCTTFTTGRIHVNAMTQVINSYTLAASDHSVKKPVSYMNSFLEKKQKRRY